MEGSMYFWSFQSDKPSIQTMTYPLPHPSAKLPTEVWRLIFRHATMVPRGFDSSLMSPFDSSDVSDGYNAFLKRMALNHWTKRTLCLVSRKWRAIAQELIFEYLFLQDGYDWNKLADGLEMSRDAEEAYGRRGAGWYVKRLEISTEDWLSDPAPANGAARVIRCCPNLRVLMVGGSDDPGIPDQVITAAFESCKNSLRCLEWSTDLGAQTNMMMQYLPTAPKLEVLFMYVAERHPFSARTAQCDLVLPSLHTLEIIASDQDIGSLLRAISTWTVPRLQRVIITGARKIDDEDPLPFFTVHGPQIRILEIDYLTEFDEDACDQALALCNNLEDLILHVQWAPVQARSGHLNVKRVGLRGLQFHGCDTGINSSASHSLDSLKFSLQLIVSSGKFPALQTVRLLDFEQERFRTRKWRTSDVVLWAFWVRRFERLGLRLEDHQGKLVKVIFSEMNVLLPGDTPTRPPWVAHSPNP